MYSFDSRVRYSEVDEDRKLSLTGVINYMQDCSTFQSEDLNMGIDYLFHGHVFQLCTYGWNILDSVMRTTMPLRERMVAKENIRQISIDIRSYCFNIYPSWRIRLSRKR